MMGLNLVGLLMALLVVAVKSALPSRGSRGLLDVVCGSTSCDRVAICLEDTLNQPQVVPNKVKGGYQLCFPKSFTECVSTRSIQAMYIRYGDQCPQHTTSGVFCEDDFVKAPVPAKPCFKLPSEYGETSCADLKLCINVADPIFGTGTGTCSLSGAASCQECTGTKFSVKRLNTVCGDPVLEKNCEVRTCKSSGQCTLTSKNGALCPPVTDTDAKPCQKPACVGPEGKKTCGFVNKPTSEQTCTCPGCPSCTQATCRVPFPTPTDTVDTLKKCLKSPTTYRCTAACQTGPVDMWGNQLGQCPPGTA